MLTNYHTHTVITDGKSTAEEVVLSAINKGFSALGFSDHAYTSYDLSYCMKDHGKYIKTINELKEKYKNEIQIYCGIEEDSWEFVDRDNFDYIVGSKHYMLINGGYYPVDSGEKTYEKCMELFNGDEMAFAKTYYEQFVSYIKERRPDIVGHFDLITKYDEKYNVFLNNPQYHSLSEKYMDYALENDVIFEINTGAMAKELRTSQYPYINLLHLMKKRDARITISSDSHHKDTIDFAFEDIKHMLRDIGFEHIYVLYDGEFKKDRI